jgi:hypothetical protein
LGLDDITEHTKTGAAHDLAGQPAGHQADQQSNENAFVGSAFEVPQFAA